jgi:hypothetical protein
MGFLQQQKEAGDFSKASHCCEMGDLMKADKDEVLSEAFPSCRRERDAQPVVRRF